MNNSTLRKLFLVALIIFYVPLLVLLWLMEQYFFFWTFVGIGITVGVGEIVSAIVTGDTLSTNFTHKMESEPKYFWAGIGVLVCLILAILSLSLHLGLVG